jgi:hypothetical protein
MSFDERRLSAPARSRRQALAWPAIYTVALIVATVVVVGPGALAWRDGFIAWSAPTARHFAYGDHVQTTYYLWLWEHAIATRSHLPFVDPFQLAVTSRHLWQPFGWPLIVVSLPMAAIGGPIAAFNATVVASLVGSGWASYLLCRQLGGSRPAGAVAGFALAFAPVRLVQAATHLNGLLLPLVPLTFLFVHRALLDPDDARGRRAARWAVAVQLSLVASGELQLIFLTDAVLLAFAALFVRRAPAGRLRQLAPLGVGCLAWTLVLVDLVAVAVILPARVHRTAVERASFAPHLADLMHKGVNWDRLEMYAYPGAVITALSLVGLLNRRRRRRAGRLPLLVLAVGLVAFVPSLPAGHLFRNVYDMVPLLSLGRTPGRILVIGAVLLAPLAGRAIDVVRGPGPRLALCAAILVAIVIDAPSVFARDETGGNPLKAVTSGAVVLHLPFTRPSDVTGSVVSMAVIEHPGPTPEGYAPQATPAMQKAQLPLQRLGVLPIDSCTWRAAAQRYHLAYVAVEVSFSDAVPTAAQSSGRSIATALSRSAGFEAISDADGVQVFRIDVSRLPCR